MLVERGINGLLLQYKFQISYIWSKNTNYLES